MHAIRRLTDVEGGCESLLSPRSNGASQSLHVADYALKLSTCNLHLVDAQVLESKSPSRLEMLAVGVKEEDGSLERISQHCPIGGVCMREQ